MISTVDVSSVDSPASAPAQLQLRQSEKAVSADEQILLKQKLVNSFYTFIGKKSGIKIYLKYSRYLRESEIIQRHQFKPL